MSNIDDWLDNQGLSLDKPLLERINNLNSLSGQELIDINKELKRIFLFFFKPPVKIDKDSKMIVDADNNSVCEIRRFGKIQYFPNIEKNQDMIALFIVGLINKELKGMYNV